MATYGGGFNVDTAIDVNNSGAGTSTSTYAVPASKYAIVQVFCAASGGASTMGASLNIGTAQAPLSFTSLHTSATNGSDGTIVVSGIAGAGAWNLLVGPGKTIQISATGTGTVTTHITGVQFKNR